MAIKTLLHDISEWSWRQHHVLSGTELWGPESGALTPRPPPQTSSLAEQRQHAQRGGMGMAKVGAWWYMCSWFCSSLGPAQAQPPKVRICKPMKSRLLKQTCHLFTYKPRNPEFYNQKSSFSKAVSCICLSNFSGIPQGCLWLKNSDGASLKTATLSFSFLIDFAREPWWNAWGLESESPGQIVTPKLGLLLGMCQAKRCNQDEEKRKEE